MLLKKISEVLKHDFFQDYSKVLANKLSGIQTETDNPIKTLSHAIDELSAEVKNLAGTRGKKYIHTQQRGCS